jgi:chorismate mutase
MTSSIPNDSSKSLFSFNEIAVNAMIGVVVSNSLIRCVNCLFQVNEYPLGLSRNFDF